MSARNVNPSNAKEKLNLSWPSTTELNDCTLNDSKPIKKNIIPDAAILSTYIVTLNK